MPITLRRKAPFWCRHANVNGKLDHLEYPLADSDGEMCEQHTLEAKQALERFYSAPIRPAATSNAPVYDGRRIWP